MKALAKSGALRDRVLATLAEGDEGEAELLATKERLEARITGLGAEAKRLLGAFSSVDAGGRLLAERLGELERDTDKHRAGVADLERRLRACAALAPRASTSRSSSTPSTRSGRPSCPRSVARCCAALSGGSASTPRAVLRVTFHEPAPPTSTQPTTKATP